MTQPTDTELIDAAEASTLAVIAVMERLHERSVLLNKILYHLAVATGRADVGAETVEHAPDDIMSDALNMIGALHSSNTIGWLRSDG